MRGYGARIVVGGLAVLGALGWAGACTGLSSDCELNLDCAGSSSTTTATTTTTGTKPDGAACTGIFPPSECVTCLEDSCCVELADCKAQGDCFLCYTGQVTDQAVCGAAETSKLQSAITGCESVRCGTPCAGKDACNPVTNDGCTTAGYVCDQGGTPAYFSCYPPPNSAVLCGACNNATGPYCGAGLWCYGKTHTCARYCCTDADCGTGKCELDPMIAFGGTFANPGDVVGVCLDTLDLDGGTGTPACDAPGVAPSNGACVAGYPPGT